jgi:integrin beta 2
VLRGINLKTSKEVKNFYSMAKNLIGIDFFYDRQSKSYEIVWSDITKDKIYLGKLRGDELHNIRAIVESDLSTTEAVAIDWIGKNVYWIDASLKQIEVATKDGLHRSTLISENISKPRSMGLDSRFGYLFWSDWEEEEPRIERATLAGEDRKSIFNLKTINGAWPNGITLDYVKKRIFFLDAKSKEIHTIDYNGHNHKRILRNAEYLHHPFAITIYENNLFWSDWRLNAVITADKFTGSNITIFYEASIQPFDVKIMHPSRQPVDVNGDGSKNEILSPCENSSCSHLCLLSTNNTYKCACPHMMRLSDENRHTCEKIKDIMFYITNKSEIRAIEVRHPYSTAISTIYHTSQIMMPNHIAIHPKEKRIFWSDVQLREIKSVKLSTSITPSDQKIETILDAEIDNVHGFTVDWMSELLFFSQAIPEDEANGAVKNATNRGGHRLLVSNLRGEYLSKVLDNVNDIYNIVVAPEL